MKKWLLCFNIVLLLVFSSGLPVLSSDQDSLVKPIKVFDLPNGQKVIIKEVHTNPIVAIDTWVRTGSVNEDPTNNGVAHFLEHLLFKGTPDHPTGEIDKLLESKGAVFNAATSKDYTHFYITIASNNIDQAINLHSDMLLNAAIPPEELEKERKIVVEEINRAEDNPDRQVFYALNEQLFKMHPYKYDTLGTKDIIQNIPREKIIDFYKKWYIPKNMTTIIVGDINTEEVLELIQKYFGKEEAKRLELPDYPEEAPLEKNSQIVEKGDYKQAYLQMGFHAPSLSEAEKTYGLDVAALIIGQGRASRLYKRLKLDENLVNSLYVSNYPMRDEGMFVFDFNLQPENIEKVQTITLEEINKLKTTPVTDEELTRAKNQVARDHIYNNESVGDVATSIGYNVTVGTLDEYVYYVEKINSVTQEDIMNAAKKYLDTNKMAVSILLPEKNEKVADENNNSTEILKPVETTSLTKENEVIKKVLPNGITLLIKSNPANDVVATKVYIKDGKLLQDKAALASLTTNLLMKGTTSRSAEDIARETEALGIDLGAATYDDYIQISSKSTKNDFTEAFMVITDILKNPTFDQSEIDKAKESMINAVKAVEDEPLSYSFEKMFEKMYKGHPYGQVGTVALKEIPNITREEIIDFHKKYFIPENMVISVVGNIPEEIAERYVRQAWADSKSNDAVITSKKVKPLNKNIIIKTPKATEAALISMGWLAPSFNTKEYPALKILNSLLSGGLSARLTKNIREKKGLAYNVGSFYPSRKEDSAFVLYLGTDPKNINTAIDCFKKEIETLQNELITEEELADTKNKINGQYALSHETNGQQAFYLGWFESSGLGYELDKNYPDLINSVTAEDIKKVAKEVFSKPYIISVVAPQEAIDNMKE
ncbi:MAG: pitrilysin family protein, partial [Cyanobacteriota bacterium]